MRNLDSALVRAGRLEALQFAEPMQHAPITGGVAYFAASLRHLCEGEWTQARS